MNCARCYSDKMTQEPPNLEMRIPRRLGDKMVCAECFDAYEQERLTLETNFEKAQAELIQKYTLPDDWQKSAEPTMPEAKEPVIDEADETLQHFDI